MFEEKSAPQLGTPADTKSVLAPAPLLDEATINRIRRKGDEAAIRAEANAEARVAKKEKADALKNQLRLEQLRTIPVKDRTEEERREYEKLYSRQRRKKDRGECTDVASQVTSREQFWSLNRTVADQRKIGVWKQRRERVMDILAWMDRVENGEETPELCGEDYVNLAEGLEGLIADVKEHGVTYLGYTRRNQDIPVDWSTGFTSGKAYWQDSTVLQMLCDESQPMMTWTKYGLLTALPDNRVIAFLTTHCGWDWQSAAQLCGIRVNHPNEVSYR